MRQINDTTFISDNLGDLKPVVIIGGKPVDKFIPNLNMSFHNDEFFINLNRRDKQAINTTDKAEIDGTDKDIFYIDENGRFKWDIEFKERPSKNSWTWELKHADGIEFYYQGELADEEIKDGCERPAEVVGSYAVYCNKANNKYKTGKLCHIYRPFCYDINAESIYADLLIADGQLTITIDDKWLDNATYPVRLDPTIGYTTAGGSLLTTSSGYSPRGSLYGTYNAFLGDTIIKYHVYGQSQTGIQTMYFAPYTIISGDLYSKLGTQSSISINTTKAWYSSGDLSISLSSATYGIGCGFSALSAYFYFAYDSGTGMAKRHNSGTTLPETWASDNTYNYIFSIYADVIESGGSSLPVIINNYRQQGVM